MVGLPAGPLRRLLARLPSHLLSQQPFVSPVSPPGPPLMTRSEILSRYRRLRQISKEQHEAVLDIIAPDVVLDWARRIGLTQGKTVVSDSEYEIALAEDLAIYLARLGRSHPLDRYARTAGFAPASDEAIVLEAMRHARFSLWRIERHHETTGLILRDLLREEEIWLIDEAMAKNARPGREMAARLMQPDRFAMTARLIVPINPILMTRPELMEEVFTRAPALQSLQGKALAGGSTFCHRCLSHRRGHRSNGLRPLQAEIGQPSAYKHIPAAPQKRQSPAEGSGTNCPQGRC